MTQRSQGNLNFLKELNLLLEYSDKIYSSYLESNKLFLYAKILYDTNQKILKLLLSNAYNCDKTVQKDATELMFHLDVWSAIWKETAAAKKPTLKDVFVFDNDVNFPKESVERLLSSGLN